MHENLFSQFENSFADRMKTVLETPDSRRLSVTELMAQSARYANALRELGVSPGDRVAVQVEKSLEAVLLYLACLRAKAVFLPLNTAYTLAELSYFINDAEPALVVCDPGCREDLLPLVTPGGGNVATLDPNGVGSLSELAARMGTDFCTVPALSDDLAAILYTSGTTGRSKGAMLTHGNLSSNALVLKQYWRFGADDVLLHMLPIYHAHGLFVAINVTLLAGASMIFCPRFDPDEAVRLMPRCTVMMGVPTFYTRLRKHPGVTRKAMEHMRLFVSGSAPLLSETHHEWTEKTGHAILERYGMTETGMNTSNPYDGERIAGTVGFPLPGVDVRVTNPESGTILARDEIGMLEIRGPNVFKGYWRMPDKTKAEIRADGFFITGDLGKIDSRGYIHIVGRGKDLIISGGFNVYPKEVETEIDAIPGVVESAVIGVPHPDFGEGVTAVVVLQEHATLKEVEVKAALEQRLAKFKLPKRVIFVDDLPRNPMGKVQKNLLREQNALLYTPLPAGNPLM